MHETQPDTFQMEQSVNRHSLIKILSVEMLVTLL